MKLLHILKNVLIGAVIGVANIIPGVSGGTMMVILNVFDRIVDAIGNFFRSVKKNILFLLPILIGAAAGILAFSKGISFMLEHYPQVTNFFFIGLIVGSIPFICREAFRRSGRKPGFKQIRAGSWIALVLMFALLAAIAFYSPAETAVNLDTLTIDWRMMVLLFVSGIVSAVAMIIPGLSGSFVMVLFGTYPIVAGALSRLVPFHGETFVSLVLPVGIPVGLGIVLGLLAGAKGIDLLLKRFPQETYFGILGLVAGSLLSIYPGFTPDWQGFAAIGALIVGFLLSFLTGSDWLKKKFDRSGDR